MHAFLQRVINGLPTSSCRTYRQVNGGEIIREMALGKKRADLCIVYDGYKYPIELKIFRGERSIAEGLDQLSSYMDKAGEKSGWLVLFDRDTEKLWDEKIYMKKEILDG